MTNTIVFGSVTVSIKNREAIAELERLKMQASMASDQKTIEKSGTPAQKESTMAEPVLLTKSETKDDVVHDEASGGTISLQNDEGKVERMVALFLSLDVDEDGAISVTELTSKLHELNEVYCAIHGSDNFSFETVNEAISHFEMTSSQNGGQLEMSFDAFAAGLSLPRKEANDNPKESQEKEGQRPAERTHKKSSNVDAMSSENNFDELIDSLRGLFLEHISHIRNTLENCTEEEAICHTYKILQKQPDPKGSVAVSHFRDVLLELARTEGLNGGNLNNEELRVTLFDNLTQRTWEPFAFPISHDFARSNEFCNF